MKFQNLITVMVGALGILQSPFIHAGTTISAANHYAYAANLGWIDWRGNTNNGAVIGQGNASSGQFFCSGYLYSANVGWISLGSGSSMNGNSYANNSATDFGVNMDSSGNLSGYAYGANIGWIAFESTGAPKVNLSTGSFSGYAYSANCGWISLSNAAAYVQTDASQIVVTTFGQSQISGITKQSNGSYFIYGAGGTNLIYTVWAATNLATTSWVNIGSTASGQFGGIQFFDTTAPNFSQRFYRLSYP
jgi:hypothetical protein